MCGLFCDSFPSLFFAIYIINVFTYFLNYSLHTFKYFYTFAHSLLPFCKNLIFLFKYIYKSMKKKFLFNISALYQPISIFRLERSLYYLYYY